MERLLGLAAAAGAGAGAAGEGVNGFGLSLRFTFHALRRRVGTGDAVGDPSRGRPGVVDGRAPGLLKSGPLGGTAFRLAAEFHAGLAGVLAEA